MRFFSSLEKYVDHITYPRSVVVRRKYQAARFENRLIWWWWRRWCRWLLMCITVLDPASCRLYETSRRWYYLFGLSLSPPFGTSVCIIVKSTSKEKCVREFLPSPESMSSLLQRRRSSPPPQPLSFFFPPRRISGASRQTEVYSCCAPRGSRPGVLI